MRRGNGALLGCVGDAKRLCRVDSSGDDTRAA